MTDADVKKIEDAFVALEKIEDAGGIMKINIVLERGFRIVVHNLDTSATHADDWRTLSISIDYIKTSTFEVITVVFGSSVINLLYPMATPDEVVAMTSAPALSANTWAQGELLAGGGSQWYKFTATAGKQYIHVSFGTLTELDVELYDSESSSPSISNVNSRVKLYGSYTNTSWSVTSGKVYYIKVRPYYSGTYKIAFNTSTTPPAP
jgi:hypothetical protein